MQTIGRVPTNGSLGAIDEDREHKQDWSIVTDEKDSWANRERRRNSVFGKAELIPASTSPKSPAAAGPRRGSILSMWAGGKDRNGKHILRHNDDHSDEEEESSVGSPTETMNNGQKVTEERERRGSILSMWTKGKDKRGNSIVMHDDEEWKD